MCAQGVGLYTNQKLAIGADQDADTLVVGFNNEITLLEKTDMVVGVRAEGTAGPAKVEVVVGAALSAVGGLRADMTLGYQYARSPMGSMEEVGGYIDRKNYHVSTVGTSFFVGAGATATIHSPIILLTASKALPEITQATADAQNLAAASAYAAQVSLQGVAAVPPLPPPIVAVVATTNTSTLTLTDVEAVLTCGKNTTTNTSPASLSLSQTDAILTGFTTTGTDGSNTVCLTSASLLCQHQTEATFGTPTNYITASATGVNITGVPGVILNGVADGVTINGSIIKLGEPVVTSAGPAAQTAAALAAAEAAAAAAAAAATAAAYPTMVDID